MTAVGILVLLHRVKPLDELSGSFFEKMRCFDPLGNTLFFCAVFCVLLGLRWGGSTYQWSNGRMIALMTMFGILVMAWIVSQIVNQKNAMSEFAGDIYITETLTGALVPARIVRNRSIIFGSLYAFCIGGAIFIVVNYFPLWFQAVRGISALQSAIHILPMIVSQLFGTVVAGVLTKRFGYYMPFVYLSLIFLPIGCGLLTTLTPHSSTVKWAGYQVIMGLGWGFGFQQANVAAQSTLPAKDVATGTAVVLSSLLLGGSVFLLVAQNLLTNRLTQSILRLHIQGIDAEKVAEAGVTGLRALTPVEYLPQVVQAYNGVVVYIFRVSLIMSCLAILGAAGMEWICVKSKPKTLKGTNVCDDRSGIESKEA